MRFRYYPCQTCLPHAHCTLSVGTFFVNCRLQIGQGLVITNVITLSSFRARPPVQVPSTLRARRDFAFRAALPPDSSVPDEAAARLHKHAACDFVSINTTTQSSRPLLSSSFQLRASICEAILSHSLCTRKLEASYRLVCFRVSIVEFEPDIQRLL